MSNVIQRLHNLLVQSYLALPHLHKSDQSALCLSHLDKGDEKHKGSQPRPLLPGNLGHLGDDGDELQGQCSPPSLFSAEMKKGEPEHEIIK